MRVYQFPRPVKLCIYVAFSVMIGESPLGIIGASDVAGIFYGGFEDVK
jgi:hypothetical protein